MKVYVRSSSQWGHLLLEDEILLVERSMTRVLHGHLTCNPPFRLLLGLDGRLKRTNLINQLVMSSSSTYMIKSRSYASNCYHGNPTFLFYFKEAKRRWLRVSHVKRNKTSTTVWRLLDFAWSSRSTQFEWNFLDYLVTVLWPTVPSPFAQLSNHTRNEARYNL